MRRLCLLFLSASLLGALACSPPEEAPAPAGYLPEPAEEIAPVEPPAPLMDVETLASVRPGLRREGDYFWRRRHSSVPGHYGAHLVTSQGRRPVLLLTVDDLLHQPQRRAWLRSTGVEVLPGIPADVAQGSWIRALVGDRYEVGLVAQEELGQDHEALLEWFGMLQLKTLMGEQGRK